MFRQSKNNPRKKRNFARVFLFGSIFLALLSKGVLLHSWVAFVEPTPVFQEPLQLTGGKAHHWFGYFDKWCQNADGLILAMRSEQITRLPGRGDTIQIGIAEKGLTFRSLANTSAWNFQQGAMLQWVGTAKTSSFIFNIRDNDGEIRSAIYDLRTEMMKMLPLPVYSVSTDGKLAVALDYKNLWLNRHEYSYFFDRHDSGKLGCGIYIFPLKERGSPKCILDEDKLWEEVSTTEWSKSSDPLSKQAYHENAIPHENAHTCERHIIHVQFSRDSEQITFLYRVKCSSDGYKVKTFQFVMDILGSDLWRIPMVVGSHHDFGWNGMLFINDGSGMYLVNTKNHYVVKVGSKLELGGTGGHGTFAYGEFGRKNPNIVLTDQRFGRHRDSSIYCKDTEVIDYHELWLFIPILRHRILVHRAVQDKEHNFKEARTDMHPRWSLDGHTVFYDFYSKIAGKQMFSINIEPFVRKAQSVIAAKRYTYIDLGGHDGDTLLFFFETISNAHLWTVYVFEPDVTNFELLSNLKTEKAWNNVNLVNAAAWYCDTELEFYKDKRAKKTGGSLIRSKYNTDEFFTTAAIDLARFIKSRTKREDYLFMKMDIEGSEFLVLPHLIRENILPYIDKFFIEWHERIDTRFYGAPRTYQSIFEAHGVHYQSWI